MTFRRTFSEIKDPATGKNLPNALTVEKTYDKPSQSFFVTLAGDFKKVLYTKKAPREDENLFAQAEREATKVYEDTVAHYEERSK